MNFLKKIEKAFMEMAFAGKRTVFYEDLAKSTERKESLRSFLEEEIKISTAKQTRDTSRAYVLKSILRRLDDAEDPRLSQVIGLSMPKADMMMLSAIDGVGVSDQPKVLRDLVAAVEIQKKAKKALFLSALPFFIMTPGVAAFAYVLSSQAIPAAEKTAPEEVWTPFNESVRVVANFLSSYGTLVLALMLLADCFLLWLLPNWASMTRLKMEKVKPSKAMLLFPVAPWLMPLLIYKNFQILISFAALSVLLKTGKTLKSALELLRDNANKYMRFQFRRILSSLDDDAHEVEEAFGKGLLSAQLLARMATISRTSPKYEDVLIEVGSTATEVIEKQIATAARSLNFLLIGLGGFLVLFLYMGQMSIAMSISEELEPTKMLQRKLEKGQRGHVNRVSAVK